MSNVVERFLRYVKFDTKSDPESETTPSTLTQMVLAKEVARELTEIGMKDVSLDENGYVMATLLSNLDKEIPAIGFIAHFDTSPDMSGDGVNPKIVENYDGEDIVLNEKENIVLSPKDFPEIRNYIGQTIITTDGTTLLGADDKAGIAEIITAMDYLIKHPEIKHGDIRVGFTPDEEIGAGANHFDVKKFNAQFAYTLDGGSVGELEYENFNAAGAKILIHGRNVHPGSAKNKMINSMIIANEFISMLPEKETPSQTEGYEGFYHLTDINGEVEFTKLQYIIRDFDMKSFESRKENIKAVQEKLNAKYGAGTVIVEVKDQYFNMREKIEEARYIVDIVLKAMERAQVKPKVVPIRGGTDGARLSFMGLPTPNIFAGGENFHGKYEYVPVESMEKAVDVILEIVKVVAQM